IFCLFFFSTFLWGGDGVSVRVIPEKERLSAEETMRVALQFSLPEGVHLYWKDPGDVGFAPEVEWNLPEGVEVSDLKWPAPEVKEEEGLRANVMRGEVTLVAELKSKKAQELTGAEARVKWLACSSENCEPRESLIAFETPQPIFFHETEESMSYGWILLFAFMGGVILNAMPCVLPVIALKVMSFVSLAGDSPRVRLWHGVAFSGGVILSFLVLAALLVALKSSGHAVGWGFQLQYPLFVAMLALLLSGMAWSFLGVFELGAGMVNWASQQQNKQSGILGSFWSGVLATALATPCAGPFLGTAVGVAMTLHSQATLGIFGMIGFGMAIPYLLLTAFPKGIKWIPKPGAWMEVLKEGLGLIVMLTVIWLVWVFASQTDPNALFELLVALFFLSVGCWIWGKWGVPSSR
ncbi:MAG: hypothetical protein KDK65_07580, partial [Chlamydiia bacterium]|nr:hypothetical protein [Chlamydiia bacterium]